jgi:carboxyl-terminal processing protease
MTHRPGSVFARVAVGLGVGLAAGFTLTASMLGGCAGVQPAPAPQPPAPLTAAQRDLNVESFDQVWTTIRDQHFDPTLGGLDWEAVKAELRPRVVAASTMDEARGAMMELTNRLGHSHVGIIPKSAYEEVATPEEVEDAHGLPAGDGVSGVHVRVVDGKALVVRVEKASAGSDAGVKAGWILTAIDGKPVAPAIEQIAKTYGDTVKGRTTAAFAFAGRLSGAVGTTRMLTLLDGDDREVKVPVTMREPSGVAATFGNMPTVYVSFQSDRLPGTEGHGDTGFMALSMFFDPPRVMPQITEAVRSFADCDGIVLDLRGNPGGIGAMAMGISGHFLSSQQQLGVMTTRATTFKFIVYPRAKSYEGPLAILIDEASASTSEILAGGLKDLGRARLFGTTSAGQALPSAIVKLPNGDGFQYAFANYVSAGGKPLEGDGVAPHEVAPPTRAALLAGTDPTLTAAVAWIRSQKPAKVQ